MSTTIKTRRPYIWNPPVPYPSCSPPASLAIITTFIIIIVAIVINFVVTVITVVSSLFFRLHLAKKTSTTAINDLSGKS